jgi:hypothetical protein
VEGSLSNVVLGIHWCSRLNKKFDTTELELLRSKMKRGSPVYILDIYTRAVLKQKTAQYIS